jgi:F0F1-type ATP synthase membrane subunit b/b'
LEHTAEHTLNISSQVLLPYFNFFVFLAAFIYFFRKPLAAIAASRRDVYLSASKNAALALESARQTFDAVKKRLDALDSEMASFKKQSDASAQDEARKIAEDTERFVRQLEAETIRLAADAVATARQELRKEIVEAARDVAATKIETDLNAQTRETILKNRISDASQLSLQH